MLEVGDILLMPHRLLLKRKTLKSGLHELKNSRIFRIVLMIMWLSVVMAKVFHIVQLQFVMELFVT